MRLYVCLLLAFSLCASAEGFSNALIHEESPYLQQHAHNPIQWHAWGEEAFEKAKREHKPIFLSIGYSTCHWCHVMARESFEDEAIAKIFNQNFVCIKVDREEMPQIDSYYQNIYQKVRHRPGGWPLSVIMSEEKEPFFITTYIPNVAKYGVEGIDATLLRYAAMYQKKDEELSTHIHAIKAVQHNIVAPVDSEGKSARAIYDALSAQYDEIYFGFDIAPKFPEASKIELLFILSELGYDEAKKMALDVLRTMALRGIYDQVDGGFFRYCVDANWEIPHFEKMLYNQAELIPLYIKAYQMTKDSLFRNIAEETIAMVYERFEKNALFYSASNAEVNDKEGGYFIYSVDEIGKALHKSDKDGSVRNAMEFRHRGNFEEQFHVGFYSNSRPKGFEAFQNHLKALRKERVYPFIDTKIIASWNAMMIEALFDAAVIDEKYALMAQRSLKNLSALLQQGSQLYHQSLNGNKARVKGLLEDYAGVIAANIKAYEHTYKPFYLEEAGLLTQQAILKFYDKGQWYLSAQMPKVAADLKDKYYTSAIGLMLQNLQRLAALNDAFALQEIAEKSLSNISDKLFSDPAYAPSSAIAFLMQHYGVISLKHAQEILLQYRDKIAAISHPFIVSKASSDVKEFLACRVGQCFAYSHDFIHVKEKIEKTLQIK